MKIGIVTSRVASQVIKEVLRREPLPSGVQTIVLDLPVPAIAFVKTRSIALLLKKYYGDIIGDLDVVVVPGLSPGRVSEVEKILGVKTVRGPKDPGLLPMTIREIIEGVPRGLEDLPYEERSLPRRGGHFPKLPYREAFKIGSLSVPERAPPTLIIAEIPPPAIPSERFLEYAERYEREGADLILVGLTNDIPRENALRAVSKLVENTSKPVLCELPSPSLYPQLYSAGCEGFSISSGIAERLVEGHHGRGDLPVFIVGDRSLADIRRAVDALKRWWAERIIIDPVLGVPLYDLAASIRRYFKAKDLGYPILLSASNATSDVTSDTHGMHALLASLALEVGASLYLVVDDPYHSIHSVAEARHALRQASAAYALGRPPRVAGSPLLVVKQEAPPPPAPHVEALPVGRVEPVFEESSFIIYVDHGRGRIIVEYRRGTVRRAWEGNDPRSLMRAVLREVEVSREHAGYLGYELHNAWLALRAGKTYVQDEEVIVFPWERMEYGREG